MRVGSLDIIVIGYDFKEERYIRNQIDKHLDLSFNGQEWDSIFIETLGCPSEVTGQSEFKEAMKEYPMLGRMWDLYEDIVYAPNEVSLLNEECLQVKAMTSNQVAQQGLRKLLFSCDEAARSHCGLLLASN
jgi:hypothetical protein